MFPYPNFCKAEKIKFQSTVSKFLRKSKYITRLFYFKKHAFKKHQAQNPKKIKKHVRNIARLRFRNPQKRILINQTIFERKYLQNTTNETNVNMFIYKVYLMLISNVKISKMLPSQNAIGSTAISFSSSSIFFCRTNIGTSQSSEW